MARIRSFSLAVVCVTVLSLLPAVPAAVAQPATEDVRVNTTVVGGAPSDVEPAQLRRLGEVAKMRGPRAKTFELSDGSFETVISSAPVHFADGRGTLREIDNNLVSNGRAAGAGWRNAANDYTVELPARLSGGPVRITRSGGWVQTTLLESTDQATAEVEGASATYAGVADGVDATVTVLSDGVKEALVLDGPDAARSFTYRIETSAGVTPELGDDRRVTFTADGATVMTFTAPYMVDGSGDELDGASDKVAVTLERDGDGWLLRMTADDAWLDDPARQWPVTIDPTATWSPVHDCAISSDAYATTNYCPNAALRVGREGTTSVRRHRILLDFEAAFDLNENLTHGGPVHIRAAELALKYEDSSQPYFQANLHQITQPWDDGATWNHRVAGTAWNTPGGAHNPTEVRGSTRGTQYNASTTDGMWAAQPGWLYWYPTELVQWFMDGRATDYGFLIKADDESTNQVMRFHSSEAGASNAPKLKIQWSYKVGQQPSATMIDTQLTDRSALGVDVGTGNVLLTQEDVRVPGVAGHDIVIQRNFNSLAALNNAPGTPDSFADDFGPGWRGTVDSTPRLRFYPAEPRISYTDPTGRPLTYLRTTTNTYTPTTRTDDKLVRNADGTFTLTFNKSGEKFFFNQDGLLRHHDDRNDNRITYNYTGDKISSIVESNTGRTVTITRNGSGQVTQVKDPLNRNHTYTYSSGKLATYTDPTGAVTSYSYTAQGVIGETIVSGGGRTQKTRLAYTTPGGTTLGSERVASVTRVMNNSTNTGSTTSYAYREATATEKNNVSGATEATEVTNARGKKTTYLLNLNGLSRRATDPLGHRRDNTYDAFDNVTTYTTEGASTVNGYTADGLNLTSVALPGTVATTLAYNAGNNPFAPSSITTPQGNTTTQNYDAKGRPNVTTQPGSQCGGCQIDLDWDANGRLAKITDQRGNVTTFTYTGFTKLVIDSPGPVGDVTVNYDANLRVSSIVDGKGQTTAYGYDGVDRVTSLSYTGGATVTRSFDSAGNHTQTVDSSGTKTTTYDLQNRVTGETLPAGGGTTSYAYDPVGNLTSFTDGGGTVTYAYDDANRLTELTEPGSHVTTFGYSNRDQRTSVTLPNGVVQTTSYRNNGAPNVIEAKKGSTVLARFTYSYRKTGDTQDRLLRYSVTDKDGAVTAYGYDAKDRLTSATTTGGSGIPDYSYTYDPAYNRTSQTVGSTTTNYTINDANQVTAAGSTTYTYDANGNQTGSSAGQVLSYNSKDQTTSLKKPGGSATSASYSGPGQLERVTAGSQVFTNSILGVSRRTGGTAQSYTRDAAGDPLAVRTGSNRSYYLTDGLGSVVAVTDASGNVTNRYTYDPYGDTTEHKLTGAVDQPWRYTGQYWDNNAGLYKMGVRYYQPDLARFTQPDPTIPTSKLPGANTYAYASCNPTNNTDPLGALSGCAWATLAVTATGAIITIASAGAGAPVWFGIQYTITGAALTVVCD